MITTTMDGLIAEKQELIRKLECKYDSKEEYLRDVEALGELEETIQQHTLQLLQSQQKSIPKEKPKGKSTKQYYSLLRKKYEQYRKLTKESLEFYKEMIEVKRKGRELMETMKKIKNKEKLTLAEEKIIEEVARY